MGAVLPPLSEPLRLSWFKSGLGFSVAESTILGKILVDTRDVAAPCNHTTVFEILSSMLVLIIRLAVD